MNGVLAYLQRIGRALMVPVATLPAAAILMGIGYGIDPAGWGSDSALAAFFIKTGAAVIDNMPILFAIGVAYGLSKDKDGAAALAGLVGYLIITTLCAPGAVSQLLNIPASEVPAAFGKIGNQFVGILVGVISSVIYNKFYQVELPKALSFFSGKRLVPIITSFVMIAVAYILMLVWPPVFNGLVAFGESIQSLGSLGAGIYAFFNRLLIPVGLHHALNSVFWFDVAGINDIPNFLNGVGVLGETGRYQAGFFPVMMFGLPAAALAMYQCAKPQNKAKIAGIMTAGAFASFFTGITEPLEFSFMFVAPVLYVIHAVLTGISVFISAAMQWIAGFGFSAGLVDLALSASNPLAKDWYMLILQGIVFFAIYYSVFLFAIKKFNLMTPGREDDEDGSVAEIGDTSVIAQNYIAALGGSDNITNIDNCITRLRLSVADSNNINESALKKLGATGVMKVNKNAVQVIVGFAAEKIADAMKKAPYISAGKGLDAQSAVKKSKGAAGSITVLAPITGKAVAITQTPDEVFASKAVGDGIAIEPTSNIVVAPIDGTIDMIFRTNHAFGISNKDGAEILVHIGIDTVSLDGKGFKRLANQGDEVKSGTPILEIDLEFLKKNAKSVISPVICTKMDSFKNISEVAKGELVAGKTAIFTLNA